MTTFASDDFNSGTGDLVGKSPVVGGLWTDGSSAGSPSPVYESNRIRQDDVATAIAYVDTAAPSADYTVQADAIPSYGGSGGIGGVVGRKAAGSGSGNHTCYIADYYDHGTSGSRQWRLYGYVTGSLIGGALLGSYTQNIGTTSTPFYLQMLGNAIRVFVSGVERIAVTDSNVTAAGYAGVTFGAAASPAIQCVYLDNFVASTASTAGRGFTRRRPSGLYIR